MQQDSGDESWLEEQCHHEISAQNDAYENEYDEHRERTLSTVWGAFQDSATAVAQLFRERSSNTYPDTGALWLPFQTAAGTVTKLYKESCDGLKKTSDAAVQSGYQKRTRDIAEWARSKKRRLIRRDDLLAYLACGPQLNASYTNRRSPKPELLHHSGHAGTIVSPVSTAVSTLTATFTEPTAINTSIGGTQLTQNNHQHQAQATHENAEHQAGGVEGNSSETVTANDLHTFKEALVLRPRGPELFTFVANEIARHCKRPASPIDDKMDVCYYNSKRPRYM